MRGGIFLLYTKSKAWECIGMTWRGLLVRQCPQYSDKQCFRIVALVDASWCRLLSQQLQDGPCCVMWHYSSPIHNQFHQKPQPLVSGISIPATYACPPWPLYNYHTYCESHWQNVWWQIRYSTDFCWNKSNPVCTPAKHSGALQLLHLVSANS